MKYSIDWKLPDYPVECYRGIADAGTLEELNAASWVVAQRYLESYNNVIDIGAHIGLTAIIYSKYFKDVYAFEPVYHELLTHNLKDIKNVYIFPKAVSDNAEIVNMKKSDTNSGVTLIVTPENSVELSGARFDQNSFLVQCVKLDTYAFEDVSFIKIDTEGYVMPLLYGAIETIKINKPLLQIEMNYMTRNKMECIEFLSNIGYKQVDIFDEDYFFVYKG